MDMGIVIGVFVVLFIAIIVQIAFWIWGIISIENAIRDDLKRYHSELTIEQVAKALEFVDNLKKKK